jgi:hypothetical protein
MRKVKPGSDGTGLSKKTELQNDLAALKRAREEVRRKGSIPWKRLRKELELERSDTNRKPESQSRHR